MLIDGKTIAKQIQEEIKQTLERISSRPPCLAVIIIGDHPASQIYVSKKTKACAEVGITSLKCALPATISESEVINQIKKLNENSDVDGILIQLPLPSHLNPLKIISYLSPDKDVDGLHPNNVGKMLIGDPDTFLPCTPLGVKTLLERTGINTSGKHALVIGRSNLVGKPMAAILMQSAEGGNATVTIAHSKTTNLKQISTMADIIIAAIGKPLFLTADMVKDGAVIIDVGINKIEAPSTSSGYQIVGDVDFNHVKDKCAFITPVPGGVGPMTIAMLLSNTLKSYLKKFPKK